jgi:hypothetical protein
VPQIIKLEKPILPRVVGALLFIGLVPSIQSVVGDSPDADPPQIVKRFATMRNAGMNDRSIIPGKSVGPLSLGDSEDQAGAVFPYKPTVDQKWSDECGPEINWVDLDSQPVGNVFIRFLNSQVSQIEVATTRYHTPEGLRTGASPVEVRRKYPGLRAYVLDRAFDAFGTAPLIFWVDWKAGLAFVFVSGKRNHRRYLYSIIVFKPEGGFCADQYNTDSPDWRELAPYSLELSTTNNQ